MDDSLASTLESAGQKPRALTFPDGSEVLILPHGGRMLGLYAPGDSRNFLWTNPALEGEETARQMYASSSWPNSGGDRAWLAPEIDFFFPNYPELDPYVQPRSVDPGSYRVSGSGVDLRLAMEFAITPKSTGQPVDLRLTKEWRAAENPLPFADDVQYAGYESHVRLEALSPLASSIGLWNLLQMPHGGEMIVATYAATKPLVVFGSPPSDDLKITERALRYRMTAEDNHKISLPARDVTGRVGYHYEVDGVSHLVVRNFFVNPSGLYVDACWTDPADRGYGFQACSANGIFGCFSELEYHVPAMTPDRPSSSDVSQVWAYRGERARIDRIARQLLGVSL